MPVYDIDGNLIGGVSPKILCYNRVFAYINPSLLCENKTINNDGTLSESTTQCVIHLPKTGCVEVRMQRANGMFKVAMVSNATVTWLDQDWNYYQTRYVGDGESDYYALCAETPDATATITVDDAKDRIAVYQFVDVGTTQNVASTLNGQHVAAIGDSITQGRFRKFAETGLTWSAAKPFIGLIGETANDADYGNYGIGGALVSGTEWRSLLQNCAKVTGYDVVFICGGTNDYGGNVSQSVFTAAYQTVVDTLKANNTEVVACSPVYRTSKTGPNTQGLTLQDYSDIIKNVAEAKEIKYIDLYTLTNDGTFITYCPDGLHPDEVGQKIIADLIISQYETLSNQ